jgi:hypothetical protein
LFLDDRGTQLDHVANCLLDTLRNQALRAVGSAPAAAAAATTTTTTTTAAALAASRSGVAFEVIISASVRGIPIRVIPVQPFAFPAFTFFRHDACPPGFAWFN